MGLRCRSQPERTTRCDQPRLQGPGWRSPSPGNLAGGGGSIVQSAGSPGFLSARPGSGSAEVIACLESCASWAAGAARLARACTTRATAIGRGVTDAPRRGAGAATPPRAAALVFGIPVSTRGLPRPLGPRIAVRSRRLWPTRFSFPRRAEGRDLGRCARERTLLRGAAISEPRPGTRSLEKGGKQR